MKTAIFFFTGTGNSLYASKELKNRLSGDVKLISIAQCLKDGINIFDYEKIGFSAPLYFTGIPELVERFIKQSTFKNVSYSFSVTTAGMLPGITHAQIETLLAKKNIRLNNQLTICFTSNYVRKFKMSNMKTRLKKQLITDKKLISFADLINNSITNKIPKPRILVPMFTKAYNSWRDNLNSASSNFKADKNCTGCGKCRDICPVDNITVSTGKVSWGFECQDCMSCIHNCPKESIQIADDTKNRGRYIHPNIDINEIIEANI